MDNNSTQTEHDWIAEETDCCLSYGVHPIARYLTAKYEKETGTKGDDK